MRFGFYRFGFYGLWVQTSCSIYLYHKSIFAWIMVFQNRKIWRDCLQTKAYFLGQIFHGLHMNFPPIHFHPRLFCIVNHQRGCYQMHASVFNWYQTEYSLSSGGSSLSVSPHPTFCSNLTKKQLRRFFSCLICISLRDFCAIVSNHFSIETWQTKRFSDP